MDREPYAKLLVLAGFSGEGIDELEEVPPRAIHEAVSGEITMEDFKALA